MECTCPYCGAELTPMELLGTAFLMCGQEGRDHEVILRRDRFGDWPLRFES